jgi:hypothetical protein
MSSLLQLYRERNGNPGFWAEPANALTNVSFLLAAGAAYWSARQRTSLTFGTRILIGCACLVGIGSFVFHTRPTIVTKWLDIVPIALFQISFLWLCSRFMLRLSIIAGLTIILAVIGLSWLLLPVKLLNGSVGYLPVLLTTSLMGCAVAQLETEESWTLIAAAGVFVIAIVARSIDWLVPFALGTHFVWHILNGFVVYLAMRSWILHVASTSGRMTDRTMLPASP